MGKTNLLWQLEQQLPQPNEWGEGKQHRKTYDYRQPRLSEDAQERDGAEEAHAGTRKRRDLA